MEDPTAVVAPAVPSPEEFPMYGCYPDNVLSNEEYLTVEIAQLWGFHRGYEGSIEADRFRQRAVGNSLGKLLHSMKAVLATPGRNGKWTAWLKEQKIPRATADRMVARYAEAFHLNSENRITEAIPAEPTERDICKLFATLWPRIQKTLTTPRSRFDFLKLLAGNCELQREWHEDGFVVFDPALVRPEVEQEDGIVEPYAGTDDNQVF